jgi:hypothetical protein
VKRFRIGLLIVAVCLAPRPAGAQAYGQFTGAECVPMGGHLFGGYVEASSNTLGLLAQLRLSFYPHVDFGFLGGLTRTDIGDGNVTTLRLGTDLKCQVVHAGPADLSLGGALGVETGDNIHLLTVGPTVVASRAYGPPTGAGITPYAGLGLLFTNAEIHKHESTDFSIPFRFGAEFRLAPEVRLMAELQLRASDEINDDVYFVTGVNLPF